MSERHCHHPDVREFDGLRCCLACGEAVFETPISESLGDSAPLTRSPYRYTDLNYKLGQDIRLLVLSLQYKIESQTRLIFLL